MTQDEAADGTVDVRSLTQVEGHERAGLVMVGRYDMTVDLTGLLAGAEVACVSQVTFGCREPGAETFVDCAATVLEASLNGVALAPPVRGRIVLPDLAEHNTLRVSSVQANTTEGRGVHRAVDPTDGEVYVWLSFEPDEAHHVFACFDQPDLKAPHGFTVTAPRSWMVLSNSGDPAVEDVADARRWTFPDTPPLSTFNTVVNAGPFHQVRRDADGHDLGILARRSLADVLERDAEEIFTLTRQGLGFFASAFGMEFPQRKLDQAFMPEFGGAMENYGCITWSDSFLRRTPPTRAESDLLSRYLLHEIAHLWFGNIVTMRWWDDLWLSEAFAEFASNWAAVEATRHTDARAVHLVVEKVKAYLADQGPSSHPIRQPAPDVAAAASGFDAITYAKGASALHQLMTYVGEPAFRAGLAAYLAKHAWGNSTLEDLMDAMATSSGRDLRGWQREWLDAAGTDDLFVERHGDLTELRASGPGRPPRRHVLAVGAYRRHDEALERTALVRVEVRGGRTPVDLPTDADLCLVNDEDLTFATVRLDPAAQEALVGLAADLPDPMSRAVAVTTLWNQLVAGDASAAEVVHAVTAVLAVETSHSLIEPYLTLAADMAELWCPDSARATLTDLVAATCRRLAGDPDRRRVALRAHARTAADLDQLAWLLEQAPDDVALRWRVLARTAELGGATDAEVQALRDRDPDPDAWVSALAVTAVTPHPAAKEAVWQALAVSRTVPIGSFVQVANSFWRPGQDHLLQPYTQRYLDLLPELHLTSLDIPTITSRLFPTFAIEPDDIRRIETAAETAAPVVRRTVKARADVVRRMLRARHLRPS
ncbi:aminopeptidase N [Terrabacter sp. Ter38]|uniref:aminopeptidase N n=1 Tax=Terrabacter sp. Ter38 TaxID=2926030 RepID=UPI002119826D|nr:aminopeptidase N [Terrabacter sp. Ter38]